MNEQQHDSTGTLPNALKRAVGKLNTLEHFLAQEKLHWKKINVL